MFDIETTTEINKEMVNNHGFGHQFDYEIAEYFEVTSKCKSLSFTNSYPRNKYNKTNAIQENEDKFADILAKLVVGGIIL